MCHARSIREPQTTISFPNQRQLHFTGGCLDSNSTAMNGTNTTIDATTFHGFEENSVYVEEREERETWGRSRCLKLTSATSQMARWESRTFAPPPALHGVGIGAKTRRRILGPFLGLHLDLCVNNFLTQDSLIVFVSQRANAGAKPDWHVSGSTVTGRLGCGLPL